MNPLSPFNPQNWRSLPGSRSIMWSPAEQAKAALLARQANVAPAVRAKQKVAFTLCHQITEIGGEKIAGTSLSKASQSEREVRLIGGSLKHQAFLALQRHGPLRPAQVAKLIGAPTRSTQAAMSAMVTSGLLRRKAINSELTSNYEVNS